MIVMMKGRKEKVIDRRGYFKGERKPGCLRLIFDLKRNNLHVPIRQLRLNHSTLASRFSAGAT